MVTIANDGDGHKAFRVLADRYWLTPSCDVQDFQCLVGCSLASPLVMLKVTPLPMLAL